MTHTKHHSMKSKATTASVLLRTAFLLCALSTPEPTPAGETDTEGHAHAPAEGEPETGWESVGWGGGSFYWATAWHPTADGVLYLGGDCAGAYRTEDKGLSWRFANKGICDYAVYSLAVSAASPDLVYVLTDGGLCKSADRAKSWTFLAASAATALDIRSKGHYSSTRAVAIDPRNPDVVFAGSHSGKLFKTKDGGATWTESPYLESRHPPVVPPAFLGKGALCMAYDATVPSGYPVGRIGKRFGTGVSARNWPGHAKLSAQVRVPEGAPDMRAQLIVQSGSEWQWQPGEWIDCEPNSWTEVTLDLTRIKGLDAVSMVHLALSTTSQDWRGDVLVDALALHVDASGKLAAGQAPTGTDAVIVADWEVAGGTDGWIANRQSKDSLKVTAVRQSLRTTGAGCVTAVAVANDGTGSVYVGTKDGGMFRSDDAGTGWIALDAPKLITSIAVSERESGVVWATCGTAGIIRSQDHGRTWTDMGNGTEKGVSFRDVALHPARPGRVYALANNGWFGTLYRSDDAGGTWSDCRKVRVGTPGNPTLPLDPQGGSVALSTVTGIAVNPKDPDQLFVCGNWRNQISTDGGRSLKERSNGADNTCATDVQFFGGKTYVTGMDVGLLVSDDDGNGWRQLAPLRHTPEISGHMWRVRIANAGGNTRIVATCSPWDAKPNSNRVLVSNDGGKTFTISRQGLPDYVPTVNCMWGRSYPRALSASPSDPDILYMAMDGDPESGVRPGGGVFRSSDGGLSWAPCTGLPKGRRMFYGLAVDPTDPTRVFWGNCGADGGVWRSTDSGATWARVLSHATWIWNIEATASGTILVGGGSNLWRSTDHGETWKRLTHFPSGDQAVVGIAVDPTNEQRIWVSRVAWGTNAAGAVNRTTDGGKTWADITKDIPFRHPIVLRYNPDTRSLWAAGAGFFTLKQ